MESFLTIKSFYPVKRIPINLGWFFWLTVLSQSITLTDSLKLTNTNNYGFIAILHQLME